MSGNFSLLNQGVGFDSAGPLISNCVSSLNAGTGIKGTGALQVSACRIESNAGPALSGAHPWLVP